jgi:hypothetical protein
MSRNDVAFASALARAAEGLRARQGGVREALSREICSIPPPVPACDVHFNRLLEDRGRVVDELQRLARLQAQGLDSEALRDFCRDCAWLDADVRAQVEALLAAAPRGEEVRGDVGVAPAGAVPAPAAPQPSPPASTCPSRS